MVTRLLPCALVIAIVAPANVEASARFVPLGFLPGGNFSIAAGVSGDGTIVVGESTYSPASGSGQQAFRWTQATGMAFLGNGPGGTLPDYATAISGDGQVIVGLLAPASTPKPFKWTQAGGVVAAAPRIAPPRALSFNGSVIVGGSANDVSGDGTVTIGTDSSEGYLEKNGLRTWLGDLPGFDYRSNAAAVSADGTMVVGGSAAMINVDGQQIETDLPFRWTEAEGMVALQPWTNGTATDISNPKLVIVGFGTATLGGLNESYRWTPATGMKSVRELLLAEGINVAAMGWTLNSAKAVSADGRVIVGTGTKAGGNPQAWLAELPVPGDFDDDGDSDGNDFLAWQRGLGSTQDADDLLDWRANTAFTMSIQQPLASAAATPVPEPPTALLIALLVLVRSRWHT